MHPVRGEFYGRECQNLWPAIVPTHPLTALHALTLLVTNYYIGGMSDDPWSHTRLANLFVDEAYASVKGYVRTYVMHQHLLGHLPKPPAKVLDVGGGAGNQSFPLAQAGYEVTILDPSAAMLDKARQRLELLPAEARQRVTLIEADGENADEAVAGEQFAGVLCHGVSTGTAPAGRRSRRALVVGYGTPPPHLFAEALERLCRVLEGRA